MIRGIKFISVPVKNQDAALKFYTDSVGFKVKTDQEFIPGGQRWIELSIPGADTGLSLFTPEGHEDRIGTFQSISFWCDDVFQTAEVLKRSAASSSSRNQRRNPGARRQYLKIRRAINLC